MARACGVAWSPAAHDAYERAVAPQDVAGNELQEAWARALGRHPDASDAWDHAIKAVEAVLIPGAWRRAAPRCCCRHGPVLRDGTPLVGGDPRLPYVIANALFSASCARKDGFSEHSPVPSMLGTRCVSGRGPSRSSSLSFVCIAGETVRVTVRTEARKAAAILRRLLDAVERGELTADGPLGSRVLRQLHGAAVALEEVAAPESALPADLGDGNQAAAVTPHLR
jgi:hypothetical protein